MGGPGNFMGGGRQSPNSLGPMGPPPPHLIAPMHPDFPHPMETAAAQTMGGAGAGGPTMMGTPTARDMNDNQPNYDYNSPLNMQQQKSSHQVEVC